MPHPQFDRHRVRMESLATRDHKKHVETDMITPGAASKLLPSATLKLLEETAQRMRQARSENLPVILAFGAHAIKNGLGPVMSDLVQRGWLTHLATNGAAIIHDWEFSFFGQSCEHVGPMVKQGKFGNWQETGFYLNLALNLGAYRDLGYGESIGSLIEQEGLEIPAESELLADISTNIQQRPSQSASAADLLGIVRRFELAPGWMKVPHRWKQFSLQAAAFRAGIPLTGHPMFGHDIIYNHPMNCGAALGRCAERDFLTYAHGVNQIDGGVYLSMGSAVMSPMVFEKSLSMAQNLAIQEGRHIDRHFIVVNDMAESSWDWSQGEPPEDNPAYYHRFNKTFSRMGGTLRYVAADNRDFVLTLSKLLSAQSLVAPLPAGEAGRGSRSSYPTPADERTRTTSPRSLEHLDADATGTSPPQAREQADEAAHTSAPSSVGQADKSSLPSPPSSGERGRG